MIVFMIAFFIEIFNESSAVFNRNFKGYSALVSFGGFYRIGVQTQNFILQILLLNQCLSLT